MMRFQQLVGKVRRACQTYDLIDNGDKIAVGLSGGKDSLTLLTALASLRNFYEKKFDIVAIFIDLFGGETDTTKLKEYCKKLNVEFVEVKSNIKKIVFDIRHEEHPCSLCANLRRGILNNTATQYGCNKVALGHHADDFIETFFMSMFYESRLNTFLPKTLLTGKKVWVIRPMIFVFEKEIVEASKNMPVLHNNCPADKHTKREYFKELINSLSKENSHLKQHLLSAITNTNRYNLFDKITVNTESQKSKK